MINSEHQPQVEKNLENLFNIQPQADEQLVEMIKGNKPRRLIPADLLLNTDDIQTILSLDNLE